jgi:Flp pilus assembly protein TadD
LAVEHYRFALASRPGDPALALRLARALRGMDLLDQAAESLDAFLAAHPGLEARRRGELRNWLGIVLDEAGELEQAEPAFRAAAAEWPESGAVHNNLGYNLLLQGKADEAAGEFREALRLNPRSEIARNNLGTALAMADSKEAVIAWESVSGPAAAHSNLAAVLIEQGKYLEARKEIAQALSYQRNHPAALANLALVATLDGAGAEVSPPAAARRRGVWAAVARGLKRALGGETSHPAVNPAANQTVKR